jgi:hypothetical protein
VGSTREAPQALDALVVVKHVLRGQTNPPREHRGRGSRPPVVRCWLGAEVSELAVGQRDGSCPQCPRRRFRQGPALAADGSPSFITSKWELVRQKVALCTEH